MATKKIRTQTTPVMGLTGLRKMQRRRCLNTVDPIPDYMNNIHYSLLPQRNSIFLVGRDRRRKNSHLFCFDAVSLMQHLEQLMFRRMREFKGPKIKINAAGDMVFNLPIDDNIHPEIEFANVYFSIDQDTFVEIFREAAEDIGATLDTMNVVNAFNSRQIENYFPHRMAIPLFFDTIPLIPHLSYIVQSEPILQQKKKGRRLRDEDETVEDDMIMDISE